ncbi:hypothetical protein C8F04DRAFT_1231925 [Mycena alexandri]|uniref:Uncharacterized protein n=1 Tax=Mycena alexandri TaxID=1745969 RepID=A0AAD6T317_9AGAR|nr:hypothetical protein C8F04DRAFT_1231925 [Mycena alexandri]
MEYTPTNAEPCFPPELEREIFELAAVWYPRAIPALLRVCHRVHCWTEPLLYAVLPLDRRRSIRDVHERLIAKPFLRTAIGHVLVDLRFFEDSEWCTLIGQILSSTESKLDVVIKGGILDSAPGYKSFRTALRQMPQHLTFEFAMDLEIFILLKESVLSTVTHLTLLHTDQYKSITWDYWLRIADLPALTHLCLTANVSRVILPQLLDQCPRLQAVVTTWLTPANSRARVEAFSYVLTTPDPRVVVTNLPDFFDEWERTARCGYDLWMRADEFIARKRRGEIEGFAAEGAKSATKNDTQRDSHFSRFPSTSQVAFEEAAATARSEPRTVEDEIPALESKVPSRGFSAHIKRVLLRPRTPSLPIPRTTMLSVAKIIASLALASSVSFGTPTPRAKQNMGDVFYYDPDLGACGWTNTTDQPVGTVSRTTFTGFPGATPKNPNTNPICGRWMLITGNNITVNVSIVDFFKEGKDAGPNDVGVTKLEFQKMASLDTGIISNAVWNITM